MGERTVVEFNHVFEERDNPMVYLHWGGATQEDTANMLLEFIEWQHTGTDPRWHHTEYLAARFAAWAYVRFNPSDFGPDGISVGVTTTDEDADRHVMFDYGDPPVFIIQDIASSTENN